MESINLNAHGVTTQLSKIPTKQKFKWPRLLWHTKEWILFHILKSRIGIHKKSLCLCNFFFSNYLLNFNKILLHRSAAFRFTSQKTIYPWSSSQYSVLNVSRYPDENLLSELSLKNHDSVTLADSGSSSLGGFSGVYIVHLIISPLHLRNSYFFWGV